MLSRIIARTLGYDGIIIDIAMDGHVALDAKMQEEKTLMRSRGNGMQAMVARVRCWQ